MMTGLVVDPWVLGAVAVLLAVAGVVASVVPAARAGRVSPVEAMQAE
jgi:ABC-type lipoprotein release transport system permease subunit